MSRYEQKERDVEKRIQANENELKLTRLDAEEKQRVIDELRTQVRQLGEHIEKLMSTKETARTTFEADVARLTKEFNDSKKEVATAQQELARWQQRAQQLEAEGEQHRREVEDYRRMITERDQKLEAKFGEIGQAREEFENQRRQLEAKLEASKATGVAIEDLAGELQRAQTALKDRDETNGRLAEENQACRAKIDQLQEDIEGMRTSCLVLVIVFVLLLVYLSHFWNALACA